MSCEVNRKKTPGNAYIFAFSPFRTGIKLIQNWIKNCGNNFVFLPWKNSSHSIAIEGTAYRNYYYCYRMDFQKKIYSRMRQASLSPLACINVYVLCGLLLYFSIDFAFFQFFVVVLSCWVLFRDRFAIACNAYFENRSEQAHTFDSRFFASRKLKLVNKVLCRMYACTRARELYFLFAALGCLNTRYIVTYINIELMWLYMFFCRSLATHANSKKKARCV